MAKCNFKREPGLKLSLAQEESIHTVILHTNNSSKDSWCKGNELALITFKPFLPMSFLMAAISENWQNKLQISLAILKNIAPKLQ